MNHFSRSHTGIWEVSASSLALFAFHCLLPHQIPEQHAEHCVRSQAQEDRAHTFIQPQQALSSAHL